MSHNAGNKLFCLLAVASLSVPAPESRACTTFCFKQDERVLVGKSFDYKIGPGMVFINKRGVKKGALPVKPGDKPVEWVSKYASLTFNQNGRELPLSGMNEKGLVVEVMWLQSAGYPKPDQRPTINELQWLQYHLDTCATLEEMIEAAPRVRLSAVYGKLHYLACDRTGACAAFEFLEGRLVITSGAKLKVKTLTNHPYAESAVFLSQHTGFGGTLPVPQSTGSLDRFVRASALALEKADPSTDPVGRAFKILDAVSQGAHSKWNFVYDVNGLRVHFRTYGHKTIKYVI